MVDPRGSRFGGIIHSYQKYDPLVVPPPSGEAPDLVSEAFEHLLAYGDLDEFTDEQLAEAIHLDPSQIAGLGPSIASLLEMLRRRKEKILSTYEVDSARHSSRKQLKESASRVNPPGKFADAFRKAVNDEQLHDLERLWYRAESVDPAFASRLLGVSQAMERSYLIDQLSGKYAFNGRTGMSTSKALEIKEELETIDRLIEQLLEAKKNARLAIIDFEALGRFAPEEDVQNLSDMQKRVQQIIRQLAEEQGLERVAGKEGRYELTPKAHRTFQSKVLGEIFDSIEAAKSGRHEGPIVGDGVVELNVTKPYEFGDSVTEMDVPTSFVNALIRTGRRVDPTDGEAALVELDPRDIEIHRTKNHPKCATAVLMDMSGSMRYAGMYVNVKRMALAISGLIQKEFPGDFLQFVEMATFGVPKHVSEVVKLMPKPVTLFDPVVRLRADMSNPEIDESLIPPHFTNIQHALSIARRLLARQDTPNRQIVLITDGLPTAHFENETLYMLYPPDPRTERATMNEGLACARDGITINIFLLQSWNQSQEDIRFAYRLAQSTQGRVFFTAGKDLDRFVVWDYLKNRRKIIG